MHRTEEGRCPRNKKALRRLDHLICSNPPKTKQQNTTTSRGWAGLTAQCDALRCNTMHWVPRPPRSLRLPTATFQAAPVPVVGPPANPSSLHSAVCGDVRHGVVTLVASDPPHCMEIAMPLNKARVVVLSFTPWKNWSCYPTAASGHTGGKSRMSAPGVAPIVRWN